MLPKILKHESTKCIYCGEFFEIRFSTHALITNEFAPFMIGWRRYRNLQTKVREHKLNCERAWLEKQMRGGDKMKICFVCQKAIHLTGVIMDNALYIGQGLYRHKSKCCPLSESYRAFENGTQEIAEQEAIGKFQENRLDGNYERSGENGE